MATVTKPIALDESINTTESPSRNIADVLAQELSGIASAITGGSDKAPKTDIATVEPSNTASRAYSVGELVYVNGNLYKVITAISIGSTFTVGTNIQSTNVSDRLTGVCFLRTHSAITISVSFTSSYASVPYSTLDNLDRANYDYIYMASNSGTNTVNVAYDQTGTGLHLSVSPANFTGSTDIQIYAIGIHK